VHPILGTLGPLQLRAYGVMLAISFIVGIVLALRRAKRAGLDTTMMSNVCLLILFSSIIGSRLLHVWEHAGAYEGQAARVLSIWEGGLSMLGGVVLAIAASFVYVKARGASFRRVADVVVPSLALGLLLTRIGCFLNGCCFGTACTLPWGVTFPPVSAAGRQFPGVPIHPTQLYGVLTGLVILAVLLLAERRPRPAGYLAGLFFILYAIGRFLVELVRWHEPSLVALTLGRVEITTYQVICVGLLAVGFYFVVTARRAEASFTGR
jgi:phosphatidylglycerol---prolipoprotein diacylglyceryl transferase